MPLIVTEGLGLSSIYGGFQVTGVTNPSATSVTIALNAVPVLSGIAAIPAGYTILSMSGVQLNVTSVTVGGTPEITLATDEQTNGILYSLEIPIGIFDAGASPLLGPFDWTFTGIGVSPVIIAVRARNSHKLQITFGDVVVESEALNPSNYSISGGETVESVELVNGRCVELTTSRLDQAVAYTVTVTGIHSIYP